MQIWKASGSASTGNARCKEINGRDRERLFFLLHQMLRTGQPVEASLRVVARAFRAEKKEPISAALTALAQKVTQGKSLSKASEAEPILFTDVHRAAIISGEASNNMTESFRLLHMLEAKRLEAHEGGVAEILTPTILLIMSLASLFNTGLNTLPVMARTLAAQGKTLPAMPSGIMHLTNYMATYWYLIFAACLIFLVSGYSFIKSSQGRFWLDNYTLKIPGLGRYITYKTYASMLLYFPHLMAGGVHPKQMIPVMEALAKNSILKRRIDVFNQVITTGGQMSSAMEKSGFPNIAVTPVKVSEHYANSDGTVNNVMIDGMHHAYQILERELTESNKRFVAIFSTLMWLLGGSVLLLEMLSIVLSQ